MSGLCVFLPARGAVWGMLVVLGCNPCHLPGKYPSKWPLRKDTRGSAISSTSPHVTCRRCTCAGGTNLHCLLIRHYRNYQPSSTQHDSSHMAPQDPTCALISAPVMNSLIAWTALQLALYPLSPTSAKVCVPSWCVLIASWYFVRSDVDCEACNEIDMRVTCKVFAAALDVFSPIFTFMGLFYLYTLINPECVKEPHTQHEQHAQHAQHGDH